MKRGYHLVAHGVAKIDKATGQMEPICVHSPDERCDVSGVGGGDVVYDNKDVDNSVSSGVVTEAYRMGWQRTFGSQENPPN